MLGFWFLSHDYMMWQLGLLVFIAPALLLAIWAQFKVHSTYAAAMREPASMSGAMAARQVLDGAGLHNVGIEMVPGHLSDHYDPRDKVLRLSPEVFQSRSLGAVGIAAHEAGHAIQHAHGYAPLAIRNAAVPIAGFGTSISGVLLLLGVLLNHTAFGGALLWAGIIAFSGFVFFQLVNLPVEFDASSRAKAELVSLGIVRHQDMGAVRSVLNAAALTYVAATLQSVLTLLYYIFRATSQNRD
jgi:Zn-dependent membrane protease YugP